MINICGGLVTYTTVLESQRRSFDAQTTVIQLTNQLLQNRVEIYRALGGNYLDESLQVQQSKSENSLLQAALTQQINMDK